MVMIAGPCVIEDAGLTLEIAHTLKEYAAELSLPLIFKASYDKANRTSLASFRGPGLEKGLSILARVKEETGLPVISDLHQVSEVAPAAEVLDVLQIPAFLCRSGNSDAVWRTVWCRRGIEHHNPDRTHHCA